MRATNQLKQSQYSPRILPLQGVANFRDLGGYPVIDGRNVVWGKLYRSGHLSNSSPADRKLLSTLGIQTLVDFRSDQEVEREPNKLPSTPAIRIHNLPIQENGMPPLAGEIRKLIETRSLDGLDANKKMVEMYRMLATKYVDEYRRFFQILLKSQGKPILWHCSAGKDRAGFAAALLLKILGVKDEIIFDDYLLSQGNVLPRKRQLLMVQLFRGRKAAHFLRKLNDVDSTWLKEAFQAIDHHWGGFIKFKTEGLALTDEDIIQLQNTFLI